MSKLLVARLKKSREKTVELEAGKEGKEAVKVTFLRPPEADMPGMLIPVPGEPDKAQWLVTLAHVQKYVTGWSGVTEATLVGAAVGGDDIVPFDAELWAEVVGDNLQWQRDVAEAILKAVVEHRTARDEVAKNSAPA